MSFLLNLSNYDVMHSLVITLHQVVHGEFQYFCMRLRQLIWHVCITFVLCANDLHVSYSSPHDGDLVVDRPVVFDASRSMLSEGPYSLQYIWGDGERTVVDDISKPVQHVYRASGLFTVRIIANNRLPSELVSEGTWRIDKNGYVAPVLDVPVYINNANRYVAAALDLGSGIALLSPSPPPLLFTLEIP